MITRNTELAYLQQNYEKQGSQLLILYGEKHMGKTVLIKAFVEDKPYIYYAARSVSEDQQRNLLVEELGLSHNGETYFSYLDIFMATENQTSGIKKVIIFDEFHKMLRQSPALIADIATYLQQRKNQKVLFLLCGSSIAFVENQLIGKIGKHAYSIGGIYKVKELTFGQIAPAMPDYSFYDRLAVYSMLGGLPGLWKHFDANKTLRENVCENLIAAGGYLRKEAGLWVESRLREPAVYHTILYHIAQGHRKLNELHELTGYSRAKISVYLKNLMEHEIVEKVFSLDTKGRENTQKGIYRIKSHLVHFYFTFLWKNLSAFQMLSSQDFYDLYIEPGLYAFVMDCFPEICLQVAEQMNLRRKLPTIYDRSGSWVGKNGSIDILALDESGACLAGFCHTQEKPMTMEDLEWDLFLIKQAKVRPGAIYLFSLSGYEEKLISEAGQLPNLFLMDEKDLWENL